MSLKHDRCLFTELISTKLIPYIISKGKHPAFDEGTERLTEKDPTSDHKKGSKHEIGLALDINLYDENWIYLTQTEDHKEFGEYWESLNSRCSWGGNFHDKNGDPKPDGNHYSFDEH